MKSNYILSFFFSFFFSGLLAQNGQDSVVYSLADTVVANQSLAESQKYFESKDYTKSFEKAEKAGTIFEILFGVNDKSLAKSLHFMGRALQFNDNVKEAIPFYFESIKIKEKVLSDTSLSLSQSYNNIGFCFFLLDKNDSAKYYLTKALQIRENVYKQSESLDLAWSYFNLGRCYKGLSIYDTAIILLKKAIPIREKIAGYLDADLGDNYFQLGYCYDEIKEYDKAIESYENALTIQQKVFKTDNADLANTINNIGVTLEHKNEFIKAIEYYQNALNIRVKVLGSNHSDVAQSYKNIGDSYRRIGEYDKALDYYTKSMKVSASIGNSEKVANALFFSGHVYYYKGDYDMSIKKHEAALVIYLKLFGEKYSDLYNSYNAIAASYSEKRNLEKALLYNNKALQLALNQYGRSSYEYAQVLFNISTNYTEFEDYEKGVKYGKEALDMLTKILKESDEDLATVYDGIGVAMKGLKRYDEAKKLLDSSLTIRIKAFGEKSPHLIYSYSNMGGYYHEIKQFDQAVFFFRKAIELAEQNLGLENAIVATLYGSIGEISLIMGRNEEAIQYLQKAHLANKYIENKIENVLSLDVLINAFKNKGIAYFKLNQLHLAKGEFKSANDAIRFKRTTISTYEASKNDLANTSNSVYENSILIDLNLNYVTDSIIYLNDAWITAENGKSQLLYESFTEIDAINFSGIPDSLLQKEHISKIDIAFFEKQIEASISQGVNENDSTVLQKKSQLFDLKRSYESLKERFEKDYPDYYRLKYDLSVVGVEEVQQKLLKPDQTLLEYFVGDSSVFIFTLNKDNYKVLEVKKDFPLDSLVEAMRTGIYGTFSKQILDDSLSQRTKSYIESATQLYDKLVAPVKSLLRGSVVVIPDGVLGYIPFDALLMNKPNNIAQAEKFNYLLNDHKISYCYSATILKDMVNKKHRQEPTQTFLAMAPYFNGDTSTIKSDSLDLLASINNTRPSGLRNGLDSLPNTGEEVTRLQRMMGGEAIVGKSATEAVFTQKASAARIIHLSTHGKMDDKVGDYSYLAFTEQPDSIENEWLYTRELYNLSLNADMVVLSACETGIGKLQRGEGIISLARAFAYAGAKSIVTTLWQVKDESTKDIMLLFYQNLKKGKEKDEALWLAKKAYIKKNKKELALPFFWSGIIPIGDMRLIGK